MRQLRARDGVVVDVSLEQLCPYQSFLLCKLARDTTAKALVAEVFQFLKEHVQREITRKLGHDQPLRRDLPQLEATDDSAGHALLVYFSTYSPTWAPDLGLVNTRHDAILVTKRKGLIAVTCTESGLYDLFFDALADKDPRLPSLEPVSAGMLNAAFARGPARTLWLQGTHRRSVVKADGKVIAGRNLALALDPLGDQSYVHGAIRAEAGDNFIIGVNPKRSRARVRASESWKGYKCAVVQTLELLEATTEEVRNPMPYLAEELEDIDSITDAVEAAFIPQALIDGTSSSEDERNRLSRLERTSFEVEARSGPNFEAELSSGAEPIGRIRVTFAESEKGGFKVQAEPVDVVNGGWMNEVVRYCKRSGFLSVWYRSGHTFADNRFVSQSFRDVAFKFNFESFAGINVKQEKPWLGSQPDFSVLGSGNSLFCWVFNRYNAAWLACDDGAGELADFVTFDESTRVLELIHVKAAGSDSDTREIAVGAFEIVCAQAIKNIRNLDQTIISSGLKAGSAKNVGDQVYYAGELVPDGRAKLVDLLDAASGGLTKRVVIVQPHIRQPFHDSVIQGGESQNLMRLNQLRTLLVGTQAAVNAVGAKFDVICST